MKRKDPPIMVPEGHIMAVVCTTELQANGVQYTTEALERMADDLNRTKPPVMCVAGSYSAARPLVGAWVIEHKGNYQLWIESE